MERKWRFRTHFRFTQGLQVDCRLSMKVKACGANEVTIQSQKP